MSIYIDMLAELIEQEVQDNDGTREDFELALDRVFGAVKAEFPDTERGHDFEDDYHNFEDARRIDVTLTGKSEVGEQTFYTDFAVSPAELRRALLGLAAE